MPKKTIPVEIVEVKNDPAHDKRKGRPSNQLIHKYSVQLDVINVHPSLVNSLRRVMISELPNVGFDPHCEEGVTGNSIQIHTNTSALHNEFIAQRIAMVPLCTYGDGVSELNIDSRWNQGDGKRVNTFATKHAEGESVHRAFTLDVTNDEATRDTRRDDRKEDVDGDMLWVTTLDFESADVKRKVNEVIRPDVMALVDHREVSPREIPEADQYRAHILLNKLKKSGDSGETLQITCIPRVGTGMQHALYSPVGTVSYSFVQSEPEHVERIWRLRLQRIREERAKLEEAEHEGAATVGPEDVAERAKEEAALRRSYELLDAKRVYQTDKKGDATRIRLRIESIGGHLPVCIFRNALRYLRMRLSDIAVCFTPIYSQVNGLHYDLLLKKIQFGESLAKMTAFDLTIHGETHTMANPIVKYMQSMFQGEDAQCQNLLDFVSYTKPPPLEEKVVIRIKLREDLNIDQYLIELKNKADAATGVDQLGFVLHHTLKKCELDFCDLECRTKFLTQFLFLQGIYKVMDILADLLKNWSERVDDDDFDLDKSPKSPWVQSEMFLKLCSYDDADLAKLPKPYQVVSNGYEMDKNTVNVSPLYLDLPSPSD